MNKINYLSKIVILVVSVVILGCTMGKDYTYENIVTEYNLEHYEATPSTQTESEPDLSYLKRPISVFDGIRIAIHNNPDIDIAISRIRQSEAIIDEANAAFWPSLAFYTEYVKADSPSTYLFKRIDQRRLASGTDFNDPGRIENFEIGFSARWNIYNGGRDVLRKKMSETGLGINRLDRLTVENALTASVIQTYYSALAAKDFIRIAKESVATVDNELRVMLVKFNAGGALKSDILSLEVRLAQTKENLIRAQNN